MANLALLCRRHHVLWHRGLLHLRDLHTPWLPEPTPDSGHRPRGDRSPPRAA